MPELNPTLDPETMPSRIRALPVDPVRGFPVPWFVAWVDGRPEFRCMDGGKLVRAVREKRCWVCGDVLGRLMTFVVGPMCGCNRVSSEPPSHTECARYSARYCPFLARPHMERREGGLGDLPTSTSGEMIRRNPGVSLLWTTRSYTPFGDGGGGVLFRLGEPESVEWWREGRPATRAEVEESVRTGLPLLEEMAFAQDASEGTGGRAAAALARQAEGLVRLYPAII